MQVVVRLTCYVCVAINMMIYGFSNAHVDIVNYLIERKNCDLSVFRDHATLIGDQPTLHYFISSVGYVESSVILSVLFVSTDWVICLL